MFSLCIRGRLVEFHRPAVMGIVNATPDSFHSASRAGTEAEAAAMAARMVAEGADMLDVGACSTRPGAEIPDAAEEWRRLEPVLRAVRAAVGPDVPVSVDTFRAAIAVQAVESGLADIVNDVSGGDADAGMFAAIASLGVPYVLMHMRGTPADMACRTDYGEAGVTAGVIAALAEKLDALTLAGVADVIVDPGFGFAKTTEQNYELLRDLHAIGVALGRPVLAGMSRKSMATKPLGIAPADALAATCALNMAALERGASVLRVHDVAAAVHTVGVYTMLKQSLPCSISE